MNPSRPCDILPTTIADRRAQFWHPGCSRVRNRPSSEGGTAVQERLGWH